MGAYLTRPWRRRCKAASQWERQRRWQRGAWVRCRRWQRQSGPAARGSCVSLGWRACHAPLVGQRVGAGGSRCGGRGSPGLVGQRHEARRTQGRARRGARRRGQPAATGRAAKKCSQLPLGAARGTHVRGISSPGGACAHSHPPPGAWRGDASQRHVHVRGLGPGKPPPGAWRGAARSDFVAAARARQGGASRRRTSGEGNAPQGPFITTRRTCTSGRAGPAIRRRASDEGNSHPPFSPHPRRYPNLHARRLHAAQRALPQVLAFAHPPSPPCPAPCC